MDDIEQIKVQIQDLTNAKTNIIEAMNNIKDVDGLDAEYTNLDVILQTIDDKKADLQTAYDKLEEEAYYQENEEQWKAEKAEELREYWRMVL